MAARVSVFNRIGPPHPGFNNVSFYGQDHWKKKSKVSLTYGVRWEVNPSPGMRRDQNAFAVNQVTDISEMKVAPHATPLWKTTYGNFAPRIGFAYQLSDDSGKELVLRGGVGLLYDTGQDRVGEVLTDSLPFLSGSSVFSSPFPGGLLRANIPGDLPLSIFDPHLKLPYTFTWNLTMQRALGSSQSISTSYVGSVGRRLLSTQTLFGRNPEFSFIRLTTNAGKSNYQSMQVQFDRRLDRRLWSLISYTWSKSLDNTSPDSAANALLASTELGNDWGPSDFDVRHTLTGALSYEIPVPTTTGVGNALFSNWTFDSIFNARSARPLNVVYDFPTTFGFAYLRPNLVSGVPLYLLDSSAAGGRSINAAAFVVPLELNQGDLGRNALRGFPFYQIDIALRRKFNFSEFVSLQLQVDAYNVMNHPNFDDPSGIDLSLGTKFATSGPLHPNVTFGESASLVGRSVLRGGGFGSFYGPGGARALRLSLKLVF